MRRFLAVFALLLLLGWSAPLFAGGLTGLISNSDVICTACVDLTTEVSGVLPIANGGTNAALTLGAGGLIYSTAGALAVQAAGTSGYFARSGGTGAPTWFDLLGTANSWSASQTFAAGGVIGTGASLTVSGTGTIAATSGWGTGTSGNLSKWGASNAITEIVGVTSPGTGQLALATWSVATSKPPLALTQTWNDGDGNTASFEGASLVVTDTHSKADSRMIHAVINGIDNFLLTKQGGIVLGQLGSVDFTTFGTGSGSLALVGSGAQVALFDRGATDFSGTKWIFYSTSDILRVYDGADQFSIAKTTGLATHAGTVIAPYFQTSTVDVSTLNGSTVAVLSATGIGATNGPQTAAQYGWKPMKASDGTTEWTPVWR